ncbi:TPA: hypothetical protein DEP58_00540 [Patescibacteria group bacterium]|nr:MAG: hypothetical protein UU98_C0039G0008 [Parcubacteria group bacterium GW2011_GWD2_42_14]HCC04776.1 hypothetical protein [Patescibacteria group bacterium]
MEDQKLDEQSQTQSDTQHEPHEHARTRLMIGVGAVVLVIVIGLVWMKWGKEIKEACVGDGEVCTVELPVAPSEGGTEFIEE